MKLKKEISLLALLFTAVGGMIGSGWLLGPFYTAKVAGPAAVLSWLIGGVMTMVIAFTFAELSTTYPVAGGTARFAHLSHGTFTSFTLAWISWLASVMVAPIETMAAIQYASNYIPNLVITHQGLAHITSLGITVAGLTMFLMCCINFFTIKYFANSNTAIVTLKLAIPIITFFVLIHERFDISHFTQFGGFMPDGWRGILTALPVAGVIFSYIGYSPAIQLAAEAKNPQRAIPFAIIGAITIAIVIYVLVEIAFIGALDPKMLAQGWSGLSYVHDAGPVAGLISAFGIAWFLKVIYFDALVSPAGTAYIYTAATARMNIAMSQNGYMPTLMQKINSHGSPYIAIITNFIIGMLFFLPFEGWQSMVSFLVSCFVLAYAVGPVACATLRVIQPDVKRPFKVPAVNLFCTLAFYICNLIVFWTGWSVVWKMMLTVGIGYIVLFSQYIYHREKMNLDMRKGAWVLPYLIGMLVISYCGSFGGGISLFKFGWDFLVILIFSICIFWYALRCGIRDENITNP